jgi:hypothetical protein
MTITDYGCFTVKPKQNVSSGSAVAFTTKWATKNVSINPEGTQIKLPPIVRIWRISIGIDLEGIAAGDPNMELYVDGKSVGISAHLSYRGFQAIEVFMPLAASAVLEVMIFDGSVMVSNSKHGHFTCMAIDEV